MCQKTETLDYKDVEQKILNLPKFHKLSKFETTKQVYQFLGKPGGDTSIVHVAGTNGKGSVCAYMNEVLTKAGYKTGMFTSPHLVSVRERIRCNHELISEEEFAKLYGRLQKKIEVFTGGKNENVSEKEKKTVKSQAQEKEYIPLFYEVLFFMAMMYFEEKNVDVIILETGLGGRLDATNVIEAPKVAVITEIGMDHMEYLGYTFGSITKEKAGIIKRGSRVVYSPNRQETIQVIEQKAKDLGVLCRSVEKPEKHRVRFVDKKIDFSFFSRYYGYIPIRLNTYAVYQLENASLALAALEEMELEISEEHMQEGIADCTWEGRMEELMPGIYIDGAHNEDGIDAFLSSVSKDGCVGKRWLLFSAVADKEYKLMKEKLINSKLFEYIYASPLNNVRTIHMQELKEIFDNEQVRIVENACEGLQEMIACKRENDFIYAVGSLYLAGEIKAKIARNGLRVS